MNADTKFLIDTFFKLSDLISFYWQFYIVVCAALLGWLFSANETWERRQKIILTICFALFAGLNVNILWTFYNSLNLTKQELNKLLLTIDTPQFSTFIKSFATNKGLGQSMAVIVHIVADLFIMLLLWTSTPITKEINQLEKE